MRIYTTELGHNYDTYSFGYTLHAATEPGEALAPVYEQGFLPYSAKPTKEDLFYMARSLRLRASAFSPTSENRRVLQKFDGQFTYDYLAPAAFRADPHVRALFLDYFKQRHGEGVMPAARIDDLFTKDLPLRIVRYMNEGTPVGYVLEVVENDFIHYWFSAYELEYAYTSLGMWLMIDAARRAKEEGRTYLYVGTGYGEKAKYKTNLPDIEFWDGTSWQDDAKELRSRMKADGERVTNLSSTLYDSF